MDEIAIFFLGDLDLRAIRALGECNFVPLAVGGGIRTGAEAVAAVRAGADKVCLTWRGVESVASINDVSRRIGSQSTVVVINDGDREAVERAVSAGAGEVLLQSRARDGMMEGYDEESLARLARGCPVPVVASSGAGAPDHFTRVFGIDGVDAAAAGAIWQFTEHTPRTVKRVLQDKGFPVRL
jgi:cyclase